MKENKQFEEWLGNNYYDLLKLVTTTTMSTTMSTTIDGIVKNVFDKLPFSMQWGVYLEFFDSVGGIRISDCRASNNYTTYINGDVVRCSLSSRTETQQEVIKKAFEILKEKNDNT